MFHFVHAKCIYIFLSLVCWGEICPGHVFMRFTFKRYGLMQSCGHSGYKFLPEVSTCLGKRHQLQLMDALYMKKSDNKATEEAQMGIGRKSEINAYSILKETTFSLAALLQNA